MLETLAVVVLVVLTAAPVAADQQTRGQRTCMTRLNAAGARVAKAVAREFVDCVKRGLTGKLLPGQSAQQCLGADNKGRVAKAHAKR